MLFSVSCCLVHILVLLIDNVNTRKCPKTWQNEKLWRVSPRCGSCSRLRVFSDVSVVSWGNKTSAVNPLPKRKQSIVNVRRLCFHYKINVMLVTKWFYCHSMSMHRTTGKIFNGICWVKANRICWTWVLENCTVVLAKTRLESKGSCFIEVRKGDDLNLSLHLHM